MTAIKEDTESHFAQSTFTVSPGIKTIRAKDVAPIAELSHLKKTTLSLEIIIAPNDKDQWKIGRRPSFPLDCLVRAFLFITKCPNYYVVFKRVIVKPLIAVGTHKKYIFMLCRNGRYFLNIFF